MQPKEFKRYMIYPEDGIIIGKLGKELKPNILPNGYKQYWLYVDGRLRSFYLHRILATLYVPNTHNLPDVIHIDGDKTNNDITNLKWVTHKECINTGDRIEKISKSKKGQISRKDIVIPVFCHNNNKTYQSISACCKDLNISKSDVACLLKTDSTIRFKGFTISKIN